MPNDGCVHIAILGARGYPSTYGGFETFVRRLAPWLVGEGYAVTVYSRQRSGMGRNPNPADGVSVVYTTGVSSKSASTFTHGVTAAAHCLWTRPDVVLALNVANGPSLLLLRAAGIPVVMNVDGLEWMRGKWGRLAKFSFRLGARISAVLAHVLIADSKEIARVWSETYGRSLVYIPYGAELREAGPRDAIDSLGLPIHGYVLVVARLAPENNVELLLDAMSDLDWAYPVVVVGSANYDNPLTGRLSELQREGRVTWLGHVSDQELLHQLWSSAGVYFHGHSVGGTNPALLQALGCGAPTVAVSTPFNAEVIRDAGVLVPPESAAVAAAIESLVEDGRLRQHLSEAGRRIVADHYDWNDVCETYRETLADAARDHGRRSAERYSR